jgi:hypothetical protein
MLCDSSGVESIKSKRMWISHAGLVFRCICDAQVFTVRGIARVVLADCRMFFHKAFRKSFLQSSNLRLNAAQKYIFRAIMSMFGNDAVQDFLVMATLVDARPPKVLAGLCEANVQYREVLKFNNSALFAPNSRSDQGIDATFWQIGTKSYRRLFYVIGGMSPISLALSHDVLRKRATLQETLQGIQQLTRVIIAKLDEFAKFGQILIDNQDVIDANQDFEVEQTFPAYPT